MNIDAKSVEHYLNSDDAGKQLKIAKLFGLVHSILTQMQKQEIEIQRLKEQLNRKGESNE